VRDLLDLLDRVSRADPSLLDGSSRLRIGSALLAGTLLSLFAGAVVGGSDLQRPWQIPIAAVKLPILLLATGLLTLPFLAAVHAANGCLDALPRTLRAVLVAELGMTTCLASLAPLLIIPPVSGASYDVIRLFDLAAFAIAAGFAAIVLRRMIEPLARRMPAWRWCVGSWLLVQAFTGMQLAWILRPFVGNPSMPVGFLRADPFTNAYVELGRMVARSLGF
jgi:hypothetical protein